MREGFKKKNLEFSRFSEWVGLKKSIFQFQKNKKICSQDLKETYFLPYGVGSMTDSGLPTTPHMHYVGRTTTSCWLHNASCRPHRAFCWLRTAHFVGCALRIMSAIQSMTRNIQSTSSSKFFLVFWHFLGWKNKFFQNCSKLPKNHFRTIKILFFFQIFVDYKGGWVVSDQIWKISRFFFFFLTLSWWIKRRILSITHSFLIETDEKKTAILWNLNNQIKPCITTSLFKW